MPRRSSAALRCGLLAGGVILAGVTAALGVKLFLSGRKKEPPKEARSGHQSAAYHRMGDQDFPALCRGFRKTLRTTLADVWGGFGVKGPWAHVFAAISPSGRKALVADFGSLTAWDLDRGTVLWSVREELVSSKNIIRFSPDEQWAVSSARNVPGIIWDVQTGRKLAELRALKGSVSAIAVSADGKLALTGTTEGHLKLLALPDGTEVGSFGEGEAAIVHGVALSPDGTLALSISGNVEDNLRLWDVASRKVLRTMKAEYSNDALEFSTDGRYALLAGAHMRVVDLATGKEAWSRRTESWGSAWAITPAARHAINGGFDGTISSWTFFEDSPPTPVSGRLKWFETAVSSLSLSRDGRWLLAASSFNTRVRVWDRENLRELRIPDGHAGPVCSVQFSSEGAFAASGSWDGTVRLWDPMTGRATRTMTAQGGRITCLAIAPDGTSLVTGSSDGSVFHWDARSGSLLGKFVGHRNLVVNVGFSPKGDRAWSAGIQTIRIWDVRTGKDRKAAEWPWRRGLAAAAVSPDFTRVVVAHSDGDLQVSELEGGKEIYNAREHSGPIHSIAFTLDGAMFLSGSLDTLVKLWRTSGGPSVRTFRGHTRFVKATAISPDGALGASANNFVGDDIRDPQSGARIVNATEYGDNVIRIWDLATGQPFDEIDLASCSESATSLAFSPDSRSLLVGLSGGAILRFDVRR